MSAARSTPRGAALALVLLLAGCATAPPAPLPPAQLARAQAAQLEREQTLSQQARWSLDGRIAVSSNGRGGSGRIDWQQVGEHYAVALSAPITRQGWRLTGDAGQARLEGLEGGPREGADPARLLWEATGWPIPVVALADWVRGARAPGLGPAELRYDAAGRLRLLEQGGWRIEYEWPGDDAAAAATGGVLLPSRLDARQGEARVKLVVDEWRVP